LELEANALLAEFAAAEVQFEHAETSDPCHLAASDV
jgi:hypothetical protein